jgi:hypothetical protein
MTVIHYYVIEVVLYTMLLIPIKLRTFFNNTTTCLTIHALLHYVIKVELYKMLLIPLKVMTLFIQ